MSVWIVVGIASVIVALLGLAAYAVLHYKARYDLAYQQSGMVAIRELVIRAAEGVKTPAPVDPETGNIYMPEARLYVPRDIALSQLTYAYMPSGEANKEELSVSTERVFGHTTAKLYTATNMTEMFEAIPTVQSCQRGVKLTYSKTENPDTDILKQTVVLNNGRTLYLYAEKACGELDAVASALKGIRAY